MMSALRSDSIALSARSLLSISTISLFRVRSSSSVFLISSVTFMAFNASENKSESSSSSGSPDALVRGFFRHRKRLHFLQLFLQYVESSGSPDAAKVWWT